MEEIDALDRDKNISSLDLFWLPSMAKLSVEFSLEVAYLKYPVLLGIYLTCILHTLKVLRLIGKAK
ncbi:hypothetical protein [Clostridium sp. UBA1056]|uniref:hypothetical protein n=1 Tax=unclassified Clostridium TaxID=2614128 RepID=UPI0032164796